MAYDPDEQNENELTPDDIQRKESELGSGYNDHDLNPFGKYHRDRRGDRQQGLREASDAQDEKEWDDLKDRIGETAGFYKPNKGKDDSESEEGGGAGAAAGAGFYKGEEKDSRFSFRKGGGGQSSGGLKKRGMQLGIAGGVVGLVGTLGLFSSFLNTFRLDHAMKNIDKKAYQRLSSSLDVRNKYLMRSYIKARITEFEGDANHDNVFFKANKVETNHPMTDWYRTLRKNGFEEKVLNKQGVYFTTLMDKNGKIGWANVKGNDSIDPKIIEKYDGTNGKPDLFKIDNTNFNDVLNKIDPDDLDAIFTVDKFDSHKSTRGAVKKIVNDEVPWFRVVKRRHIRKDIHNVTGIKNWRFFEKSRDKVAAKKQDIKNKVYNKFVDKFYGSNPNSAALLKCLFSDGKCASTDDSESGDGHGTPNGDDPELKDEDVSKETTKDGDGKTQTADKNLETKATASEVESVTKEAISDEANDATAKGLSKEAGEKFARASASKRIIYYLIAKVTGQGVEEVLKNSVPIPDPTKIWTWAKRIAKLDGLLGKGGNSKISKMVKNARRAQLIGIFGTLAMSNDQIKSGKLVGDELNDFFAMTANLGNSEGWGVLSGQISPEEAKKSSPQKDAYCKEDFVPKSTDFAYFCNSKRPDSGGKAEEISKAYSGSIGIALGPIASVVNKVEETIIGTIFNKATDLVGKPIEAATQPLVNAAMGSDFGQKIGDIIGTLMGRLMDWLGAGPMFDGTGNDIGNLIVAGGVAQAESTSRASGAFKSTPQSAAYSDDLSAKYAAEVRKNQSFSERYFSLESPDSVASTALFAATNTSASSFMTKIGSVFSSFPRYFGSAMSGKLFAQSNNGATDLTGWAGSGRYDIPQQCIDFEPTSPLQGGANYYNGTNYFNVTGQTDLDYASARDNDKFYQKVYAWAGTDNNRLDQVQTIWNCWLLDARAMGGIGFPFGYNQDAGYDPAAGTGNSSTPGGGESGILAPGALAWPTRAQGSVISSCYGPRGTGFHRGLDISGPLDLPIFAAADGTVSVSPDPSGYGPNYVIITHADGTSTSYGHMNSTTVKSGDQVKQAQQIGVMGYQGHVEPPGPGGNHLHFNVYPVGKSNIYNAGVDPLKNGLVVPPGVNNRAGCPTS